MEQAKHNPPLNSSRLRSSFDRARAYLAAIPPAVSGNGGHGRTFAVACVLVHGFLQSEADSLVLIGEWNAGCSPPWSEAALRHKIKDAIKSSPRKARGWLLGSTGTPAATESPEDRRKCWPKLRSPTRAELLEISERRNVGIEGLNLAVARRLIFCGEHRGYPAWIIADASRMVAQARRMDGKPFDPIDPDEDPPKALTLGGSCASLPVGLPEAAPFPNILLVEGSADYVAAHHFITVEGREHDCAAVALLGANQRIAETALPAFSGKHVRIFPHRDNTGLDGAANWTRAILPFARTVDGLDFTGCRRVDGEPIEDLNDVCHIHADDFEENRVFWNLCPP